MCDPAKWLEGTQLRYKGWKADYNNSSIELPYMWGQGVSLRNRRKEQFFPYSSRVYRCAVRPPGTPCSCYHVVAAVDHNPDWLKRLIAPWMCGCPDPQILPLAAFLRLFSIQPFMPWAELCCRQLGITHWNQTPEEPMALLIEAPYVQIPRDIFNDFYQEDKDGNDLWQQRVTDRYYPEDPDDPDGDWIDLDEIPEDELPEDPYEDDPFVIHPLLYYLRPPPKSKKRPRRQGKRLMLTDRKYANKKRSKPKPSSPPPQTSSSSSSSSTSSVLPSPDPPNSPSTDSTHSAPPVSPESPDTESTHLDSPPESPRSLSSQ